MLILISVACILEIPLFWEIGLLSLRLFWFTLLIWPALRQCMCVKKREDFKVEFQMKWLMKGITAAFQKCSAWTGMQESREKKETPKLTNLHNVSDLMNPCVNLNVATTVNNRWYQTWQPYCDNRAQKLLTLSPERVPTYGTTKPQMYRCYWCALDAFGGFSVLLWS